MSRLTLACGLLLAGGISAQQFAGDHVILTGFAQTGGPVATGDSFPAVRIKDINKDGVVDGATESFVLLTQSFASGSSFSTVQRWIQEGDEYVHYFADSGDGAIVRAVDGDNDGVFDHTNPADTVTEFFDLNTSFAPEALTLRYDATLDKTVVYVGTDDQSGGPMGMGAGIYRFVDLDGNGDAKGAGEFSLFVSAGDGLTAPAAGGGTVPVSMNWVQWMTTLPSGDLAVYNGGPSKVSGGGSGPQLPEHFVWYKVTDTGGVPSLSVLMNPAASLNGVVGTPDFDATTGRFPEWVVELDEASVTSLHDKWSNVNFFGADDVIPNTYYFSAQNDSRMTGGFSAVNPNGVDVHGLFYRWSDNGDEVIDAGELSLFANFSGLPITVGGGGPTVQPFTYNQSGGPVASYIDAVFGFSVADGQINTSWSTSNKGFMSMQDLDFDGVIETMGANGPEAFESYSYAATSQPTPAVFSPMFGPFIKSHQSMPKWLMPGPFDTGLSTYGDGCPVPTTGLSPQISTFGGSASATIGTPGFEIALLHGNPLSPAFVLVSAGQASINLGGGAGGFPLGLPQCDVLVDLNTTSAFPFTADQNGFIEAPVPVPQDPSLMGSQLFAQWATIDLSLGDLGLRFSNGLAITLQ